MSSENVKTPVVITYPTRSLVKEKVFEAFMHFMSLPSADKATFMEWVPDVKTNKVKVPTQKDFALKYGVSVDTLVDWKKRKDYIEGVELLQKRWGQEKVNDVMASLYTRAMKYGMAYDVEVFLAYYTGWNRAHVVKQVDAGFGVNDMREIINRLPADKRKDAYAKLAEIVIDAERYGSDTSSTRDAVVTSGADQGGPRV